MNLKCFGTYHPTKTLCRWFCRSKKCIRETGLKAIHAKYKGQLSMPCFGAYTSESPTCTSACHRKDTCMLITDANAKAKRDMPCFGTYVSSNYACVDACGYKETCRAQSPECQPDGRETAVEVEPSVAQADNYGAASAVVYEPTGSAAPGTVQSTQVEGGSTMNASDLATREKKARDLKVVPAGDDFLVKSSTRKGGYMVTLEEDGTHHCACMDYALHRKDAQWRCKHVLAVEIYLEERGPTQSDSRYDVIDLRD